MTNQKTLRSRFYRVGAFFAYLFIFAFLFTLTASHAHANSGVSAADAGWTKDGGADCSWLNSSWIACNDYVFSFDVTSSTGGSAVFKLSATGLDQSGKTLYGYEDMPGNQDTWYLILTSSTGGKISNSTSGGVNAGLIKNDNATELLLLAKDGSASSSDPNGQDYRPDHTMTTSSFDASKDVHQDGGGNLVYAVCGLYTKPGQHCYSTSGGYGISGKSWNLIQSAPDVTKATGAILDSIQSRDNCTNDAGAIGFVLCPILDTTNNAVKALTGDGSGKGFLVELLTVKPLVANSSDPVYRAWEGIRNIALGLYIVVFALIVFGNGVGYDPYTIKRALPRLAIGVLLTFASFFIVQTLVDLSNIIGNSIPAFLSQLTGVTEVANYSLSLNFVAGAIAIVLWIILLFVALGALLIGIAGLVTRLIIIYALVLLGPIAFVAWVLPNTENMFKKWWSNLIRVLMMFPIVTGMLSLAILFQQVILSTQSNGGGLGGGVSQSTAQIVAAVAPLIAIILIPKTFKWGGDAFIAAAGYMAGKATSGKDKVSGAAKGFGKDTAERTRNRAVAGMLERSKSNMGKADDLDGAAKKRATLAGRAQRALGITAAGKLPTKRGLVAAGVRAGSATKEQAEMEETAAQYYSSAQLQSEMERSAAKLKKNPNNAMELARFRGLQKQAIQSNNIDALNAAKKTMGTDKAGRDAYLKASMPNLGDIGDKFAGTGGFAEDGSYFDPSGMSAKKIAGQHKKMLQEWVKPENATFTRMTQEQIEALQDPRLRQDMSAAQQEQIDIGISQWYTAHSGVPRPSGGGGGSPTPPPTSAGGGPGGGPTGGGTPPTTPPGGGSTPPGSSGHGTPMGGGPTPVSGGPGPATPPGSSPISPPSGPVPSGPTPMRPGSPVRPMGSGPAPTVPSTPAAAPPTPAPSSSYDPGSSSSTPSPTSSSASPGGPTIINNNTTVNSVTNAQNKLEASRLSYGSPTDSSSFNAVMQKLQGLNDMMRAGTANEANFKRELKRIRMDVNGLPSGAQGDMTDAIRDIERGAGLPELGGDHPDVDVAGDD